MRPRTQLILSMAVALLGAAILATPGVLRKSHPPPVHSVVRIRDVEIPVEVRSDPEGRAAGLSGRASLPEGSGMLFLFPKKDRYSFWMKDMQFPLDFVWISEKKIVAMHEHVPPPLPRAGGPPLSTFAPPLPVDTVLEVNAGFIERHGIKIGDPVEISLDPAVKIE